MCAATVLLLRVDREESGASEKLRCYNGEWTYVVCMRWRACVRQRGKCVGVPSSLSTGVCGSVRCKRVLRLYTLRAEYESSCAAVLRGDGCALRQDTSLEEGANSLPIIIVISILSWHSQSYL